MTDSAMEQPSRLDAVREQAAYWLLEHDSDDAAMVKKFESWLAENTLHRQVFEQMQQMWSAVNPEQQQARKRARQRRQTGTLCLCLLVLLLNWLLPWQYWRADYSTAVGQINTIALADGSTAILNTNSAINVTIDDKQRRVELIQGEVLLQVRQDDRQRRFIVSTNHATAEALGTAYSVKQAGDHTRVRVYESSVRITASQHKDEAILRAGQQATVSRHDIRFSTLDLPPVPDWVNHRLVFNRTPLPEIIARLDKYHAGVLTLLGNHAQQAQFTGVLPTDDSQAAVQLLADTMGLTVYRLSPYLIVLK